MTRAFPTLQRLAILIGFVSVPVMLAAAIDRAAWAQGHNDAVASIDAGVPSPAPALTSQPIALPTGPVVVAPSDPDPLVVGTPPTTIPAVPNTPAEKVGMVTERVEPDPMSLLAQIITFARSGKGRLAFGAALVLLVWGLRSYVFPRVAWLQTKAGGYVAGFGTAAIVYIGGGLAADLPLTLNMLSDALVAGFTASGKWEALADFAKRIPTAGKQVAAAGAVLLFAITSTSLILTGPGCQSQPHVGDLKKPIIACAQQQLDGVDDVIDALKPLAHDGKWDAFESAAISHGVQLGGCAASAVINLFLAPQPGVMAPPPEQTAAARNTLEHIRSHFGGVVWRDADGNDQ